MCWGARVERRRSATQTRRASGSPCAPSCSTITAATASPHSSSGTPITAQSATAGVHEQHVFDLARREVLPAPDDDVVQAALDEEEALGIEPAPVVGGQPALGRQRRPLAQIFARDLVAPHPDLPVGPGRNGPRPWRPGSRPRGWASGRPTEPRRARTSGSLELPPPGGHRGRARRWSSWSRSARRR